MPIKHRSNNRILPANSRAVDVAKQAIRDIMPLEQRRYQNAFEVQGYETLVYNKLRQGTACSCQANRKVFTGLLGEDGKMPAGHMNELLTGGMTFTINTYGARQPGRSDLREPRNIPTLSRDDQFYGELTSENNVPSYIENHGDLDDPFVDVVDLKEGSNGPQQDQTLDEVVEVFDADSLDQSYTKCTVCMGTGFVSGYSLLGGWRYCLSTQAPELDRGSLVGTIEVNQTPHAFYATKVDFDVVLPKGLVYLDAFHLWNNTERVNNSTCSIDDLPFSTDLLRAMCDGRKHRLTIEFDELTYFTHLEIQIGLTDKPALLEFPRLTSGTNLKVKDLIEDVQINASPTIPKLTTEDVLVESTFGKAFIVGTSNWWNDNKRNVLGWDVSARVIQSSELLSNLPQRRQLSQRTTNLVRDNVNGIRRT